MTTRIDVPAARIGPRHKVVLVLLLGTQFMLAADFSIFNVALPAVGRGVGLTLHTLQWVATAYALPAAGFTLLFGRVADLAGRRRMLLIGLGLLAAASLFGGTAHTPVVLLSARVAQGLSTAIAAPAALSLITTTFPEGPLRARALGLNGAITAAGFTCGALLGGVLTGLWSWRWAFLVNVPVALVIVAAVPRLIPEGRDGRTARLDLPGAVTVTLGLLALIWGVTTGGAARWAFVPAAALLAAFLLIELRSPDPLAPVHVLRRRTVGLGVLGGLTTVSMATGATFLMTVHLQETLGLAATTTGLAFGAAGLLALAGGTVAPRLIGPMDAPGVLALGLAIQGLAVAGLLVAGTAWWVVAALAACYFGNMVAVVAYVVTVTSGLPDHEQGLATGLSAMAQQVGTTVGIPLLSTVATAPAGVHPAIGVNAAITMAVALLVRLLGRVPATG
ncbi:MFS transporter [Actinoallomurus sp. NBC_01490]|jgi:MFS family permease|uniref:MFS transporter n=1 Tax=Actinoallomurus sp. NBC_01490 TaxID=2903557 RepID=UPI002E341CE7|nr:MFS transporter [Actinoallomurus sp. NBC_01490]